MLRKLRFVFAVVLLIPIAAAAQRMPEERGYDHRGGDYDHFRADDVDDCRRTCERDRRCQAYTFNLRTEVCYLKDEVRSRERNIDTVTGSKERWGDDFDDDFSEEEGYDYRGGDFDSFRSDDVRDCRRTCSRERRCVAYTFNERTEMCYLKDEVRTRQRNSETITGVRDVRGGEWPDDDDDLTEERGYDYHGGDYDDFEAASVSACKNACRRDDRCVAYTFNLETETCYLKDRIGDYRRNADTVTGVKEED
jgi:hypothetical protein